MPDLVSAPMNRRRAVEILIGAHAIPTGTVLSIVWQRERDARIIRLHNFEELDRRILLAVWLPENRDKYLAWAMDPAVHGTGSDIIRAIGKEAGLTELLDGRSFESSAYWHLPRRLGGDPRGIAGLSLRDAALKVVRSGVPCFPAPPGF